MVFLCGLKLLGRHDDGVEASHLLFAYDILVYPEGNTNHLNFLTWRLRLYRG